VKLADLVEAEWGGTEVSPLPLYLALLKISCSLSLLTLSLTHAFVRVCFFRILGYPDAEYSTLNPKPQTVHHKPCIPKKSTPNTARQPLYI